MMITVRSETKTQFIDITSKVQQAVRSSAIQQGYCLLFVPHTTAAITINENADPSVKTDILSILNQIIPWEGNYHHMEGNSAAHIKSTLVGVTQWIPIENGQLILGTWQGIFFCEFDGPRTRKVHVSLS